MNSKSKSILRFFCYITYRSKQNFCPPRVCASKICVPLESAQDENECRSPHKSLDKGQKFNLL